MPQNEFNDVYERGQTNPAAVRRTIYCAPTALKRTLKVVGRFFKVNSTMNKFTTKSEKGFSLVELLVAATITMLCIISIVAMLRKGREIDINDRYRRYARAIVVSEFEKSKFHYNQYTNLLTQAGTVTKTVVIDDRGTESDITGTLTTTIGAQDFIAAADGMNVPYIPVTINVSWSTPDGNDNITLTKHIAQAGE